MGPNRAESVVASDSSVSVSCESVPDCDVEEQNCYESSSELEEAVGGVFCIVVVSEALFGDWLGRAGFNRGMSCGGSLFIN